MTRTRQWTLGAVAIAVVIALAGWFLLVQGERRHAASLQAQTAAQQAANQQMETQIAVLKQQNKKLPEQEAKLAELKTIIPNNPAMPPLIQQLSAAAKQSGVTLNDLTPTNPQSTAPTTTATGGTVMTPGALAYVDVTLTFSGNFFESEEFVNSLENLDRGFLVSGLTLSSDDSSTSKAALSGTMTARVFFSPDELPTSTEVPTTPTVPTPAPSTAPTTAPSAVQ